MNDDTMPKALKARLRALEKEGITEGISTGSVIALGTGFNACYQELAPLVDVLRIVKATAYQGNICQCPKDPLLGKDFTCNVCVINGALKKIGIDR